MKSVQDTDRLIRSLVANTGTRGRWDGPSMRRTLIWAVMVGLALATAASLALFAETGRLGDPSAQRWIAQKIVCMAVCAAGAWQALEDLARPERDRPRLRAFLLAACLIVLGALFDASGVPLTGRSRLSVPTCTLSIVALSLPALALILAGMRQAAATTRPTAAGAAAGLLAGSLGASAYALACRNDGGLFILVWYGSALAIAAALGALAGRSVLRW